MVVTDHWKMGARREVRGAIRSGGAQKGRGQGLWTEEGRHLERKWTVDIKINVGMMKTKTFSSYIYPQCIILLPQVTNATKITYCGWKDCQTRKLGKIENGDIGLNIFISFCPHLHHSDPPPTPCEDIDLRQPRYRRRLSHLKQTSSVFACPPVTHLPD